jgi:ComF family protein
MAQAFGVRVGRGVGYLLSCLYPPRCRFCKQSIPALEEGCFCARCKGKIRLISHPLCGACGRPFFDGAGEDHSCGACLTRAPRFVKARAWACYPREGAEGHPLRDVLQQFKYGRKASLGKPLGRLMARAGREEFSEASLDCIVPVPLHPKRLRWRGFNQSVILGEEVARLWGIPMDPLVLLRAKETLPQTQLSEEERRSNVRAAFTVNPRKSVRDRSLLVLDDVYTSGATVNECSRALLRAGAKEIYVLTLAHTIG